MWMKYFQMGHKTTDKNLIILKDKWFFKMKSSVLVEKVINSTF